ncbi:MAG TPA: M23 family metallopeptidase [Pyrinomonadaceae bacterium]
MFSFPGSNHPVKTMKKVKIALDTGADPDLNDGRIAPGVTAVWSNGRVGQDRNEVYLDAPAPPRIAVDLIFEENPTPFNVTLGLIPYTDPTGRGALILPFAPYELRNGEYLVTSALHLFNGGASGTQIFAHDIGIEAKVGGSWSSLLPETNGSQREHYRIWGKPVRAVADGQVLSWENDVEDNPRPNVELPDVPVGGNSIWVTHGKIEVQYSHLQKGTIPVDLMKPDAPVKAGQQLGLAGNSGNTGGFPHLHMEGRDTATHTLRGLPFKNGWVLPRSLIQSDHSGDWVRLTNDGIPRTKVAIWPASTFPRAVIKAFGIARSGDWTNELWYSSNLKSFQTKVAELSDRGMQLIHVEGFMENGKRRWAGVARSGHWATRFFVTPNLRAFELMLAVLNNEGFRLTQVMTYLRRSGARSWAGIARSGDWEDTFFINPDAKIFKSLVEALDKNDSKLVCVTTYFEDPFGKIHNWIGVAHSGHWKSEFFTSPDGDSFRNKAQELLDKRGLRLIYATTYEKFGRFRWAGIARSGDWSNVFWFSPDLDSFDRVAQDLFNEQGLRLEFMEFYT